MKNLLLTTVAVFSMAGAAFAGPVVSGEVSLDFAETAAGDWGGAMGLDLGIDAGDLATVSLGFSATDGNSVTLDNWTVGTTVGSIGVAIGDDNGVFVGAEDGATLADPAMAESVKVSVGDAAVAVGFTDWTADVTDISNIQGAYSLSMGGLSVTASGDYNLTSENILVGASVGGFAIGAAALSGAVTYDVDAELFAFEGVMNAMGMTAYVNGDQNDAFQNVGGSYDYALGGATLSAGANYNVDAEEFAPTVGISFAF